jgi:hypothetical protein
MSNTPAYESQETGERQLPSLPHSCETCGARFERGESEGLREHRSLCATWMNRVPVKDENGNTLGMLGGPDPVKLARHVQYSSEGAEPWLHLLEEPGVETVNSVLSRRSRGTRFSRSNKRRKTQKLVGKA